MKINAEGGEITLSNDRGDIAIIPKTHRQEALNHLKNGNHKALDELISSLPYMEDYADEGTIIPTDPPTKPEIGKKKEPILAGPGNYPVNINNYEKGYTVTEEIPENYGFGNVDAMRKTAQDWRDSYGTDAQGNQIKNPPKFISNVKDKYGRYQQAPNPTDYTNWTTNETISGQHCLGSACRAAKQFNPSLPTIYDVLGRQLGVVQESTEGETGLPSLDSWEIHQKLQDTGTGTILFNKGLKDKDREEYIKNFDPSQLPLGTLFGHGDATGKTDNSNPAVDTDAKSYRGKNEPLPRHSSVLVKYDEATGDMLIYDYGHIRRVANRELTPEEIKDNESKKEWDNTRIMTWPEFAKKENIVYATKINQAGDYTYGKLKNYKTEREEKVPEEVQSKKGKVSTKNTKLLEDLQNLKST